MLNPKFIPEELTQIDLTGCVEYDIPRYRSTHLSYVVIKSVWIDSNGNYLYSTEPPHPDGYLWLEDTFRKLSHKTLSSWDVSSVFIPTNVKT